VKLIDLEDLVILGPGSEWLWTMVSGIVLAVTFLAIYRQLSLQRDAAAIEQVRVIYREWADERMSRAKLETLSLIRDGAETATVLTAGVDIGDFWEGYAYLVKSGNIDRRLMYDSLGPAARIWWGLLASSARAAREQANDQGVWIDFEWLAGIFAEFDRVAGEPAAYDAAYIARRLPDLIETNRTAVARFEELRAVIIRPGPIDMPPRPTPSRKQTQRGRRAAPAGAVSAV
jgi:hypothetical protein